MTVNPGKLRRMADLCDTLTAPDPFVEATVACLLPLHAPAVARKPARSIGRVVTTYRDWAGVVTHGTSAAPAVTRSLDDALGLYRIAGVIPPPTIPADPAKLTAQALRAIADRFAGDRA